MRPQELRWPGGYDPFVLNIGELRALQSALNAGPEEVWTRLRLGQWRVEDLEQVLIWGLIGGGCSEADARRRVANAMAGEVTPLVDFKMLAQAVLSVALLGDPEDRVGEQRGAAVEPAPEKSSSA